jgi:hypothetical protein
MLRVALYELDYAYVQLLEFAADADEGFDPFSQYPSSVLTIFENIGFAVKDFC